MASDVHKFYCHACNRALFGETASVLAANVNNHNDRFHPLDFCGWLAMTIVQSEHYAGPSTPPPYLAKYTHPERAEWGGAKPPDITERDKIFLVKNFIRWD